MGNRPDPPAAPQWRIRALGQDSGRSRLHGPQLRGHSDRTFRHGPRASGLDVQTYGVLRTQRSWPTRATTTIGRPSATAYYKFDSGITGLLTANTDFSDAPLDNRQVNTTRFSLFEAETREFFLEDSGNFEFGRGGSNANGSGTNNGRPFFSRNIGLVSGRPVDIARRRQAVRHRRSHAGGRALGAHGRRLADTGPDAVGAAARDQCAEGVAPRHDLSPTATPPD